MIYKFTLEMSCTSCSFMPLSTIFHKSGLLEGSGANRRKFKERTGSPHSMSDTFTPLYVGGINKFYLNHSDF